VAAVIALTASKGDSIEILALDGGADNNKEMRSHTAINSATPLIDRPITQLEPSLQAEADDQKMLSSVFAPWTQ